jgi:hypothetical protein
MRLVKSCERHQEVVEIRERRQGNGFNCGPPLANFALATDGHTTKVAGQISFSSCVIDFQSTPFELMEKIMELKFGEYVYRGVLPLKSNGTIAECMVDFVEKEQ